MSGMSGIDYAALSGLSPSASLFPGRCPGLYYARLSGVALSHVTRPRTLGFDARQDLA